MNRSEELAKLLGIKPKSLCEIKPLEYGEECHTEFPCYVCEADEAKYYPDFTKPDNFVKLLDIIVKCRISIKETICSYQDLDESYEYNTIIFYARNYETMGSCMSNKGNGIAISLIKALLNYDKPMKYYEISKDTEQLKHKKIAHNNMEKVKRQAQQTDWTY